MDSLTELASQSHWWKPAAESFTVTFTTGHLIVNRPTVTRVEGTESSAWQVTCEPAMLAEPVGQHRIKRVFVTKPSGFMWDHSDIHIVADDDGRDLAITVAGVETLTARRLALPQLLSRGSARHAPEKRTRSSHATPPPHPYRLGFGALGPRPVLVRLPQS
ncbi:MAG: hypothetical protein KY393_03165, partial [Actinobacteria bacterium]|nr:hypothetical protein [Actinomycetota bacterium]